MFNCRYHWVCVGLTSKPPRGSEWLCTSCSGSSSKLKRKATTPEVKSKRAKSVDPVEETSKRTKQIKNDLKCINGGAISALRSVGRPKENKV